ncbi:MAG: cation:proton antiporter, partial [Rhodoglobus sp.]
QLIAWQNGLSRREGLNASAMLQNRGEFALILATLAVGAGLDPRLTPFAGLYVLMMAVVGPILAVNSERIGGLLFPAKRIAASPERERMREEGIALVEAATAGQSASEPNEEFAAAVQDEVEQISEQAAQQSDEIGERRRDPEY